MKSLNKELIDYYKDLETAVFTHHSGNKYQLLNIANSDTTDSVKFPILAVYISLKDYKVWARPLQEFIEKFKEDEPLSCDGCGVVGLHVTSDGFGFNCCYKPCDSYTVRGISRSDFY